MWTASVVMGNPVFDRHLQMAFIERDQNDQTLAPWAATESLTYSVGHGRPIQLSLNSYVNPGREANSRNIKD
jgi:hypothetical protein